MRGVDYQPPRRLESRLAAVLAYLLGIAGGIIMLMFEREDRFVRLHAVQSIVFSSAVVVVGALLLIAGLVWIAAAIGAAAFAMWLVLIARAARGDWWQLPAIGAWAERNV